MATFTDYTFLVTNLLTGGIIDQVELQSFNYNEILNRPGSGQATARLDLAGTNATNFSSWKNALWMYAGDEPVWGGIMGTCTPIGNTRALNIPIKGFMEYARNRLIRSDQGMTYNTPQASSEDIVWTAVDKFRVAKDMIDHMQSFDNGDIGLNVIWDALSDDAITNTYHAWQHKLVGEAFDELADNINGFDWEYVFDRDIDGLPQCNIKLHNLPMGRRTDYRLEYDQGPGIKNIASFDPDTADVPVNGTAAIGQGEGDSMTRTYYADVPSDMPLYEDTISYKSVSQLPTLVGHATKHVMVNQRPKSVLEVKLESNLEPTFTQYRVGDELLVVVDDSWVQYEDYYRVFARSISFSKEMDIEVKISLQYVGA